MKYNTIDLTKCDWTLYGTMPYAWRNAVSMELGLRFEPEVGPIPVSVPGSVQQAMINAGLVKDWRYDLNAKDLEWIENRHWIYNCAIDETLSTDRTYKLVCEGLDYSGWVYLNSYLVGTFNNSFTPHSFTITPEMIHEKNLLRIIFSDPPRWLGQLGYTSQIKQWKPRFYYTWDWIPRVVQTAITAPVRLYDESIPSIQIDSLQTAYQVEDNNAEVDISLQIMNIPSRQKQETAMTVMARVMSSTNEILAETDNLPAMQQQEIHFDHIAVLPWWPNMEGDQNLYSAEVFLYDTSGNCVCMESRQIGFKQITWVSCRDAPEDSTPWICQINGRSIFLQGVNWTPVMPTFADVPFEEVRKRLLLYRDMGCNLVRVWGGAVLESDKFYQTCSQLGLMIWQELPLSSSGIENWPPEDAESIHDMMLIAESYITRRSHYVSLLMHSGGNELQGSLDGRKTGMGKPIDFTHPMMQAVKSVFDTMDPSHRLIPTSPFGPRFNADSAENNQGFHWSVHGPWNVDSVLDEKWSTYWENDDSLFRAETGCPGAMDMDVLKKYVPHLETYPVQIENPVWGRTSWWIESDVFEAEHGRPCRSAEEYCIWSQNRQAQALKIAVSTTKKRFPACGGIIIWMGHDCFPCAANTSIIDVDGNPKPAYYALKDIFRFK